MPETMIFRGAILRDFDLRQGKEGASQVFVRIHMSVDYNEQICAQMGWDYLPECAKSADLIASICPVNFILTPGDKALAQHELNFNIATCEDFKLKSKKSESGDDDERDRHLDFIVTTPEEIEPYLGQYIRRVGRHEGQLRIGYTKQEKLDLGTPAPDQKSAAEQPAANGAASSKKPAATEEDLVGEFGDGNSACVSCNNRIPYENADKTIHATGQKCQRNVGNATLGSAASAGGTHQARKSRKSDTPPDVVN